MVVTRHLRTQLPVHGLALLTGCPLQMQFSSSFNVLASRVVLVLMVLMELMVLVV